MADEKNSLAELAVDIVSAYVGNNTVPQSDLPRLIADVYSALRGVVSGDAGGSAAGDTRPGFAARSPINPDHLVCMECHKKFKSLKRHLRTHHGLSPEEYKLKRKLRASDPMVAPNYAKTRSGLAKSIGLGQRRADPDVLDE